MSAHIDHLVVAATSLAQGEKWCEATLGVTPGAGGEHALFGTHNQLLRLACDHAPNAYLEIIAVNPHATPTRAPPFKRWFDLDDPTLQSRLTQQGPQFVHWVASVPNLQAALEAWRALGIERGAALTASRPTPAGLLEWEISVRDDGQRLLDGCLPTLIEWGAVHPQSSMPNSGLRLQALHLRHPKTDLLKAALQAIDLQGVAVTEGEATLSAQLKTSLGNQTLNT